MYTSLGYKKTVTNLAGKPVRLLKKDHKYHPNRQLSNTFIKKYDT